VGYASNVIGLHLESIAGGKTYADLGEPGHARPTALTGPSEKTASRVRGSGPTTRLDATSASA
jgi:hypothetical protein